MITTTKREFYEINILIPIEEMEAVQDIFSTICFEEGEEKAVEIFNAILEALTS